jgi:anti-anti-sigma factor
MRVGNITDSTESLLSCRTGELAVRWTVGYRCARLALRGLVDDTTAPWLTELLVAAGADPAVDVVVVDLAAVTFFGAAGLHCFNHAADRAAGQRARISVWDPPPFIRRVLTTGGLDPSILLEPPDPR